MTLQKRWNAFIETNHVSTPTDFPNAFEQFTRQLDTGWDWAIGVADFDFYLMLVSNYAPNGLSPQMSTALNRLCQTLLDADLAFETLTLLDHHISAGPVGNKRAQWVLEASGGANDACAQLMQAAFDRYPQFGQAWLNAAVRVGPIARGLWNTPLISFVPFFEVLRTTPAAVIRFIREGVLEQTTVSILRALRKHNALDPALLIAMLKQHNSFSFNHRNDMDVVVAELGVLFPSYVATNYTRLLSVMPNHLLAVFLERNPPSADHAVDVVEAVIKLKPAEFTTLIPTVQRIFSTIEWNENRFEALYTRCFVERIPLQLYLTSNTLNEFVALWLQTAPEKAKPLILPYIRDSGHTIERTPAVEKLLLSEAVGSASSLEPLRRKL